MGALKPLSILALSVLPSFAAPEEEIPDLTEKPTLKPAERFVEPEEKPVDTKTLTNKTSTSISKLFVVSGGNAKLRSTIARLADQVTEELRLEIKDGPPKTVETVVSIVIHPAREGGVKGSPYRRTFGKNISGNYYIRLDVDSGRGLEREPFRAAIIEMLLLERSLRNSKQLESDQKMVLHAWVVDGLLEVINWRAKLSDRNNYKELSKNPSLFDVAKLMDIKRSQVESMDAATHRAYKASAGALVLSLLNQTNGVENFRLMLAEVSLFQGDMDNLLRRHFPQVNKGKEGVKIAWMLQLAVMAMNPVSDTLTILQTERKLDEALVFRYVDESGVQHVFPIADFKKLRDLTDEQRKVAVLGVARKTVQLNYRCFPLYRSILMGYSTSLNALSAGHYGDVETILHNLANERKLYKQSGTRARDYLDWYLINHSTKVTGDYSAFDAIDAEFEDRLLDQRSGQLSKYLDVLEKVYR